METHPSSENPSAAPDKSRQAVEEKKKIFQTTALDNFTVLHSFSEQLTCVSAINMRPQGQAVAVYANQSLGRFFKNTMGVKSQ